MSFKSSLVFKHYVYKLCWGNYPSLKAEVTVWLQDNIIPNLTLFKTFYWDGIYAQAYFSSEDCAEFLTHPITRSLMWWADFILKKLTIDLQINGPFLKVPRWRLHRCGGLEWSQGQIFNLNVNLTDMQSTSCEIPGCMNHRLESRLLGKISITSDMQMIPLWGQKSKRN